jgi:hypothetical protein
MQVEGRLCSDAVPEEMTKAFEHARMSRGIRPRVRDETVSEFTGLVSVIRSLDEQRQNV